MWLTAPLTGVYSTVNADTWFIVSITGWKGRVKPAHD